MRMKLLTKSIGSFPLGIWIVLVLVIVLGAIFGLIGQGLSLFSWETAVVIGLQEDQRDSPDIVERTMGAVSQGEAYADVLIQVSLVFITVIGILRRRYFGFIAGIGLSIIWIYVTPLVLFQRVTLFKWGLVPDLSRFYHLAPLMIGFAAIPGALMLVCLVVNRRFFGDSKSG